ncbi:MAG: hypothetical protein ACREQ5_27865, partial [Candidatus Dormibacteria bacterium]
VFVRPVSSTPRRAAWRLVSAGPAPGADTEGEEGAPVVVRRFVRYCALWWWLAHRGMVRSLVMSGHHLAGARRLVFLLLVDLAAASVALFLFAMIVSPFLGL